jgi:hypothetical protein
MLTACWSGAAVAQTSPLRNLDIFVGTVLTYDDNVFRIPDGVTRPGTRRSDWSLAPTVTATYTRPLARGDISVSGRLAYQFHKRNTELDRESIGLTARANTALWRCDVSPNLSFQRQQSDLADIVDTATVKNAENRLRLGTGILCGNDSGFRPGVEYIFENVTNSSTIREISDFHRHTYIGRLGYARPALGMISIYGQIQQGSYPNRPALAPGVSVNDEVKTYSGGIAYSREIGTRLSGSVSVGYMKVKARPSGIVGVPGTPGFKGLTYAGSLNYRGSDRISGSLSFERATQQSNLLGVDYSLQTQFSGSVTYAVSRVVSLTGNASYTRRSFRGTSFVVPGVIIGSGDRTTQFGGTINFQSFRRLNFALGATHYIRNSPLPNLDYTANRFMLTSGLRF